MVDDKSFMYFMQYMRWGGDKLYSWETDTIKFTHVAPEIEKNKNKSVFFIGINLHVKYVFFIHLFA